MPLPAPQQGLLTCDDIDAGGRQQHLLQTSTVAPQRHALQSPCLLHGHALGLQRSDFVAACRMNAGLCLPLQHAHSPIQKRGGMTQLRGMELQHG